jgi:hypothetical protein
MPAPIFAPRNAGVKRAKRVIEVIEAADRIIFILSSPCRNRRENDIFTCFYEKDEMGIR